MEKQELKASNTTDLELHNVQINTESGPAFLVRNSKDLILDGVSTRLPHVDAPVIRIDSSPGAVVMNSKAYEGTHTFISTGIKQLKDIVMVGNVTNNAKKITDEFDNDFWTVQEPPTEGDHKIN